LEDESSCADILTVRS